MMALASHALAQRHGLTPLAQVAGYGRTQDSHHATAPHPEGIHASRAIMLALNDARIGYDEVVYINPHGTGTPTNDPIETLAITRIFGKKSATIPISSIKSMLGHMIGAAGAIESIICVMTIQNGTAHAAINLDNIDEKCASLDHILCKPRSIASGAVVKISIGFGGSNVALVFLPA